MTNNKIYILDNGSAASKLLQHEYKDAEVVKVTGSNLVEQFTKFENNKGRKIYLPFTVEQLADNNEQLRKDIQKVESLGFKNLIVLPYEGDSEKTIQFRAKEAGILDKDDSGLPATAGWSKESQEILRGVKVNEDGKPYKSVTTTNR